MARNKKRGSSTPRGGRGGRGGFAQAGRFSQYTTDSSPQPLSHFSLAEEARQTSRQNHSFWEQSSNLRSRPVKFVSAGTSEPLKQLDEEIVKADEDRQDGIPTDGRKKTSDESLDDTTRPDEVIKDPPKPKVSANEVTVTLEESQDTPIPDPGDQISDQDVNDSSSDKIIGPEELERGIEMATANSDQPSFFFDLKGSPEVKKPKEPIILPVHPELQDMSSSEDEVLLFKGREAAKNAPIPTTISVSQMQTEIRIVEKQFQEASLTKKEPSIQNQPPAKLNSRERRRKQRKQRHHETNDDDDLIADYIANMKENGEMPELLRPDPRNRRDLGGTPSPIVSDGSEDEAESSNKPELPQASSKSQEIPINNSTGEKYDTEDELNDQTLTKLLADQGWGPRVSGQDGEVSSSSDSDSTDEELATTEAAAFDDFDLMDWNRPSLVSRGRKRKGKAALAQLNFGMSDSETEQKLRAAWKNDRLKKSERKKQREELRALGQLGKKGTSPEDMRVKYPAGMSLDQVADELRTFLMSSDALLTFPPMDTHARKMIHELANKFNVKSKSAGKSDQRRTTLARTVRTLGYQETAFNNALGRIHRKYFPRLDTKGKRSKGALPPRTGGSGHAEASYREGEVVGAAAPELASDNRGRAMLEKMGWNSGDALGALNNKGILQPVAQTMKKTKAGLG